MYKLVLKVNGTDDKPTAASKISSNVKLVNDKRTFLKSHYEI